MPRGMRLVGCIMRHGVTPTRICTWALSAAPMPAQTELTWLTYLVYMRLLDLRWRPVSFRGCAGLEALGHGKG